MYKKQLLGSLLALFSASTYALLPVFTTRVFEAGLEISTFLFMRFLIAASCLWVIVYLKKSQWRLNFEQLKILLPATLAGFGVNCTAFFYAYKLMSPSIVTILFFMYPFFVLVYEVVIQKQPLFIYKILALVLAFTGLIFIIWDGNTTLNLIGVALSLGAGICYAGFCSSLTTRPLQTVDAYVLSAWATTLSAIIFMTMCLTQGQPLLSHKLDGWFYTSLIAIICTVVATVAIYTAIQWIGATNASIIATTEPIIVFIFGFLFLQEKLTISIALGIMLVITGLLTMQWPEVKKGFLRKAHRQTI